MKWLHVWLLTVLLAAPAGAQEPVAEEPATAGPIETGIPVQPISQGSGVALGANVWDGNHADGESSDRGFLTGDKGFGNFIGFVSNPSLAIDPRSLTQLFPIYTHSSMSPVRPFPDGTTNAAGLGLSVALTERLNIGLTKGAYAWTDFHKTREGWLDLGGYVQYTLIRDVHSQFLATVGLGWTAPSGSSSVFQGSPPANLNPYVTVGKEINHFHILATAGYSFPAGSGGPTTQLFYGAVHLDRRCLGWLYPLVEFNWGVHTTQVNLDAPFRHDFFDLDSFTASGNIVTVAPGLNAMIIQDKLEIGAVYETPIASENHVHFNGFLVKVLLRF
jgi:hypothetical protein